ncbi:hypothetical protein GE09DRAFT_1291266 [Coniochaeta sp. 2T2.1]|nr:hypothetical protein GE09DRAFT_1291266 [Coniochaeta sp. 2T2.1]
MSSDNKRGRSGSEPTEIQDNTDADVVEEQPPSKRRRTQQQDVHQPPEELEDGEVADISSSANTREASPVQSTRPGHTGWNAGVKPAGLRTSFGPKTPSATSRQVTVPTSREPDNPSADVVMGEEHAAAEPSLAKKQARKLRKAEKQAAAAAEGGQPPDTGRPLTRAQKKAAAAAAAAAATAAAAAAAAAPSSAPANESSLPRKNRRGRQRKEAVDFGAAEAPAAVITNPSQHQQVVPPMEKVQFFMANRLRWQMPPSPSPDWLSDATRTWEQKFTAWLEAFMSLNHSEEQMGVLLDPNRASLVLTDAYPRWHGHREWKKKAGQPLQQYKKQEKLAQLISTIAGNVSHPTNPSTLPTLDPYQQCPDPPAASTNPRAAEGHTGTDEATSVNGAAKVTLSSGASVGEANGTSAVRIASRGHTPASIISEQLHAYMEEEEEDTEDKAYRERYYPGIGDDQLFCTSCATGGHRRRLCPEATCRFCGDSEHMAAGCPTRQRCSKCKQLGHDMNSCREKLALAPGEEMKCAFCASKEHTESDCTEFFHTYRASDQSIYKVKNIPIFCFYCGKDGHYGTECGLNPTLSSTKSARVETWSKENWQQYVDANSTEVAIADAGVNAYAHDANGRPNLGKSIVPERHIFFQSDDDDEDEGFLRPPIQKPQQNGQINVSRQGQGGFSSLARQAPNPPLPPGPPPGLPARPPQASDNWRNNRPRPSQQNNAQGRGNGQQHGRGGGGGGGRGAGRGGGGGGGMRIRGGASRGRGGRR